MKEQWFRGRPCRSPIIWGRDVSGIRLQDRTRTNAGTKFPRKLKGKRVKCSQFMSLLSEKSTEFEGGMVAHGLWVDRIKDPPSTRGLWDLVKSRIEDCEGDDAFDLNMLSSVPAPLGLFCNMHGHLDGEDVSSLKFRILRKPDGPIPENVIQDSAALGGYPSGLWAVFNLMGNPLLQFRATLSGWMLDKSRTPFGLERRQKTDFGGLKLKDESLTFEHSDGSTIEISFESDGTFGFRIKSDLTVTLDEQLVEKTCEHFSRILDPIFPKDGTS